LRAVVALIAWPVGLAPGDLSATAAPGGWRDRGGVRAGPVKGWKLKNSPYPSISTS
jgi:hypothetical protein